MHGLAATLPLYGEIERNAPYQWANLPTADTSLDETIDYLVAKLNGKDAAWAGAASLRSHRRTFIVVNETSEPPRPGCGAADGFAGQEAAGGASAHGAPKPTSPISSTSLTLPAQAATLAEKLKASGATSVVFAGDPIMPIYSNT